MTAKQSDLNRRIGGLVSFLYESELRQASDAIQHGRYAMAYTLIKVAEGRKT